MHFHESCYWRVLWKLVMLFSIYLYQVILLSTLYEDQPMFLHA